MGTTPTPLRISVDTELYRAHPTVWDALLLVGHTLNVVEPDDDVFFSPRAWRLLPEHIEYLPLALKEVRAAVKAKQVKGKQKGVRGYE